MFGAGPFNPNASKGGLPGLCPGSTPAGWRALFPDRGGAELRGNAALERGTAAAFSQERRSPAECAGRRIQKHTQLLKQTVDALNTIKGQDLWAQLLPANLV